jgi:hypothetical protein
MNSFQSEQKRFLQQHKQRSETYSKAAATIKKQRKKNKGTTKTGLAMDKELKVSSIAGHISWEIHFTYPLTLCYTMVNSLTLSNRLIYLCLHSVHPVVYSNIYSYSNSFLPLGAAAQGELWPPEHSASILLYSLSTGSSYLPWIYFILEVDYLVSQQFNFYGVRLASRPTSNLEDQAIPLCLAPTP